jgi:hypothetical protein
MDIEAIREAVHRQPFLPFRLKLADGREILVRRPDFIAVAPTGRRVGVFGEDGAMSLLGPLLIVSLEVPAPPQGITNPHQN